MAATKVLEDIKRTRESLKASTVSSELVLEKCKSVLAQIESTNKKFEKLDSDAAKLFQMAATVLSGSGIHRPSMMESISETGEDPPHLLDSSPSAVAAILRRPRAKVIVLSGAGMSVASGIPDFRSPGGLYSTLQPDLLTASEDQRRIMWSEPTHVVSYKLFRLNQLPYLEVRRPFILGLERKEWKPTLAHFFIQMLAEKGLLQRHYTQNIDGLDYATEINSDLLVNVHGSMATVACEACGNAFQTKKFVKEVETNIKNIYGAEGPQESKCIMCPHCSQSQLKPTTVLYGRPLPASFHSSIEEDQAGDDVTAVIVMGTSLSVSPANQIVTRNGMGLVGSNTHRIVINREAVESPGWNREIIGTGKLDCFLKMDCDKGAWSIAKEMGWQEDLRKHAPKMCEESQKILML